MFSLFFDYDLYTLWLINNTKKTLMVPADCVNATDDSRLWIMKNTSRSPNRSVCGSREIRFQFGSKNVLNYITNIFGIFVRIIYHNFITQPSNQRSGTIAIDATAR